jgi:hypothetical protein
MSSSFTFPVKDPDSTLRHAFDWSAWLDDGETITSSTITSSTPAELVVDKKAQSAGVVSYRVSGGEQGKAYQVRCRIETSNGRIDERTALYRVRQR